MVANMPALNFVVGVALVSFENRLVFAIMNWSLVSIFKNGRRMSIALSRNDPAGRNKRVFRFLLVVQWILMQNWQ